MKIRGWAFDVDGTLVDSFPPHIQFCIDMNEKYGCSLDLPDMSNLDWWRERVGSPMSQFFKNVGFSPTDSNGKLREDYEANFSRDLQYKAQVFPGISDLLYQLYSEGISLGLISSNCKKNIESALGDQLMELFPEDLIWDITRMEREGFDKTEALKDIVDMLSCDSPRQVMYVGDMPGDLRAALEAGTRFTWAAYGWKRPPLDVVYRTSDFGLVSSV